MRQPGACPGHFPSSLFPLPEYSSRVRFHQQQRFVLHCIPSYLGCIQCRFSPLNQRWPAVLLSPRSARLRGAGFSKPREHKDTCPPHCGSDAAVRRTFPLLVQMNSARRIQALRPHRQKSTSISSDTLQSPPCVCAEQWRNDELATYIVIIVIISIALWESWSRNYPCL